MRRTGVFVIAAVGCAAFFALICVNNTLLGIIIGASVGAGGALFYYVYPRHVGYAEHKSPRG